MQFNTFAILLLAICTCNAYPEGAPQDACSTLEPQHEDHIRQTTVAPFAVHTDATTYQNGKPVSIAIEPTVDDKSFKGFVMVARRLGSSQNEGEFFPSQDGLTHVLDCGTASEPNFAITHSSNVEKNHVTFQWLPAEDFKGTIIFTATVVQNYENFWTGVKSQAITIT